MHFPAKRRGKDGAAYFMPRHFVLSPYKSAGSIVHSCASVRFNLFIL
jgi:hypothetical protein